MQIIMKLMRALSGNSSVITNGISGPCGRVVDEVIKKDQENDWPKMGTLGDTSRDFVRR